MAARIIKKHPVYEQTSLLYDTPLAKAIPSRPITKGEMFLIVCIQFMIQKAMIANEDCCTIEISPDGIAKARKKRLSDVKHQCEEAVDSLIENFLTQKVVRRAKNGVYRNVEAFPMYSHIKIAEDGMIRITVSKEYIDYYKSFVLAAPDLVIPMQFYMNTKSQYSYSLINWLTARIFEIRQHTGDYKSDYELHASYEEILKVVPPMTEMTKNNYKNRVLMGAIKDINKNPFSQICIKNFSTTKPKGSREIDGYNFEIEIYPTRQDPMFLTPATSYTVNKNDTPSWEVLEQYMKNLHSDESFIRRMKERGNYVQLFKSILYTLLQPESRHTGAYLNKIYRTDRPETIYSLCLQIDTMHPERRDPCILKVIEKHEEELRAIEESKHKNDSSKDITETDIFKELVKRNPKSTIVKRMKKAAN